jgi:hypothetical protein
MYQLVPPRCHRRNTAERAIRTFKEHFVAGLSSMDPYFPMNLWDRLVPQAEMTLNLLRTSRLHPHLSAAAHFHGLVRIIATMDNVSLTCKVAVAFSCHIGMKTMCPSLHSRRTTTCIS